MKNNQNKILIVIIVVLALALVILGGYMIYQKQNNTTNDTINQEENTNEEQNNLFSLNDALEILNTVGNRTKVYQILAKRTTMVNDMNDLQNIEKINLGL